MQATTWSHGSPRNWARNWAPLCAIALLCLALPAAAHLSQDAAGKDPAASATEQSPSVHPAATDEAPPGTSHWEYKVIGLADIHGDSLDYVKRVLNDEKGKRESLLSMVKNTDEQFAQKTEDVLNEWGQKGWELEWFSQKMIVFKRPIPR